MSISSHRGVRANSVKNEHLADMAGYSFKGNVSGTTSDPADVTVATLPDGGIPGASEYVVGFGSGGELVRWDISSLPMAGAGSTDLDAVYDSTTVTITSSTGDDAIITEVTTNRAGVMSATDKIKLDSIDASANLYVHPHHTGDVTSVSDGPLSIGAEKVLTGHIKDLNVTQSKIALGSIDADRLLSDAVKTVKIENNAVTNAKLADVPQYTLKGRKDIGSGDASDLAMADVPTEGTPAGGDYIVGWDDAGLLVKYAIGTLPTSGGGEANDGVNVGVSGVGVYDGKVGTNIELRKIDAGSSVITVALNGQKVDIDVDPSQIDGSTINNDLGWNNYVHENHTGHVHSSGLVTTIQAGVVSNAMLSAVPQDTLKGRVSVGAGDPEDLTVLQVQTLLNIEDGANNYTHPNHFGDVVSNADGETTIQTAAVENSMLSTIAQNAIKGRVASGTGAPEDLIFTSVPTEAAPAAGDFVLGWDAAGVLNKYDVGDLGSDHLAPYINVKDAPYNATGDGVTDDTAAIQSAIAAAQQGTVFFPTGTYRISSDLVLVTNTHLVGEYGGGQSFSTQLLLEDAQIVMDGDDGAGTNWSFQNSIENMTIQLDDTTPPAQVIYHKQGYWNSIKNVKIYGAGRDGLVVDGGNDLRVENLIIDRPGVGDDSKTGVKIAGGTSCFHGLSVQKFLGAGGIGVHYTGGDCDIFGLYAEQCLRSVRLENGTTQDLNNDPQHFSLHGGNIYTSGGGVGIAVYGSHNCNIYGTKVERSPTATAYLANYVYSSVKCPNVNFYGMDRDTFFYADHTTKAGYIENVNIDDGVKTEISVRDYGAIGDGITDDTAAIQAALDASAVAGTYHRPAVFIPAGRYLVTDEIDVQDRIEVLGSGRDATIIQFEPTAADKACMKFSDTSPYHWFGGVRDLTIRMADETHNGLAGIYIQTGTRVKISNINVDSDGILTDRDWYGLHIQGREQIQVSDCTFNTPVGIYIESESGGTGLDNCNFHNITYLSSSGGGRSSTVPSAGIYVDPTCNLQSVSFDGHQTCAGKDHYIHWRTTSSDSHNVAFRNVRTEAAEDPSAYEVDMNGSGWKFNVLFDNCRFQGPANGVHVQNGNSLSFTNCRFQSSSKIAIKTVGANSFWMDDACTFANGATAELQSWWQTYQAIDLSSSHGSQGWVAKFPANATSYFVLPHISRYETDNSTSQTISALQSDDYTQATGFNSGHEIELVVDSNTTISHGTGTDEISLVDGQDWSPGKIETITLRYNGTGWAEVSRSSQISPYLSVRDYGATGDGVTDDTAAIQAALDNINAAKVYVPAGTYIVSSTLTIPASSTGWTLEGSGSGSIIKGTMTDGSAILDLNNAQHCNLQDISIRGSTANQNCIGLQMSAGNRWSLTNVDVRNTATGVDFTDAFIGSLSNLFIRYSDVGFIGSAMNDVGGIVKIENCDKGFEIDDSYGVDLQILCEGDPRTGTSRIDGCRHLDLHCYWEDTAGQNRLVPELSVGTVSECSRIAIDAIHANVSGNDTEFFAFDDVNGLTLRGSFVSNNSHRLYTSTDSTRNLRVEASDPTNAPTRPFITGASRSTFGLMNYWPNPFMFGGMPSLINSGTTNAEETTIVPPFGSSSLKVSTTDTVGTSSTSYKVYTFAEYPHLAELKGKKIGVGYWVYYANGANYTIGSGGNGPEIRLLTDGAVAGNTLGRYTVHAPDQWNFQTTELTIPDDATQITCYYYGNRGATVNDATMVAYFVGPLVWVGGLDNALEAVNGNFSHHPAASADALGRMFSGSGSPEGTVSAPVGSNYQRTDGGAGTTLYVKESGTGNTGWVAMEPGHEPVYANILDYGGVPDTNTAPAAAANTAAVAAARLVSNHIYFPSPAGAGSTTNYYFDSSFTLADGEVWSGDSYLQTRLHSYTAVVSPNAFITLGTNSKLQDLYIHGTPGAGGGTTTGIGIHATGNESRWSIQDVQSNYFATGLKIDESWIGTVKNGLFRYNTGSGIDIAGANTNSIHIIGGEVQANDIGIEFSGACNDINIQTAIEGNTTAGIKTTGNSIFKNVNINNCYFELNGSYNIHNTAATGVFFNGSIANNSFHGTVTQSHVHIERADSMQIGSNFYASTPPSGYVLDMSASTVVNCTFASQSRGQQVAYNVGSVNINPASNSSLSQVLSGTGSPEGVVAAPVGKTFTRTDGGSGSTLYIKESGTGNTGWVAVAGSGSIGDNTVTNAKLSDVATNTIKGRTTAATGDPEDLAYTDVTTEAAPTAGDFALGWDASGALVKYDVSNFGGGSGHSPIVVNVKESPYNATGNGVADDSTAIQSALNAGADIVFLPPGSYLYNSTLNVPNDVCLTGTGNASILLQGTADRHVTLNNGSKLQNVAVDGNIGTLGAPDPSLDAAVQFLDDNGTVTNCHIYGTGGSCVTGIGVNYCRVENNHFSDYRDHAVYFSTNSNHCVVTGNTIEAIERVAVVGYEWGTEAIQVRRECSHISISNNTAINIKTLVNVLADVVENDNISITGNTATTRAMAVLMSTDSDLYTNRDVTITGNTFECIDLPTSYQSIAMYWNSRGGVNGLVLSGNTIRNYNELVARGSTNQQLKNAVISDNCFVTDGTVTASGSTFLTVGECDNVVIKGNLFEYPVSHTSLVYAQPNMTNTSILDNTFDVTHSYTLNLADRDNVNLLWRGNRSTAALGFTTSSNVTNSDVRLDLQGAEWAEGGSRKYFADPTTSDISQYRVISDVEGVDSHGNVTGATTLNLNSWRYHTKAVTLTGDWTPTFSASRAGNYVLVITQDATGGWGVTWPALEGSDPIINLVASKTTIVKLFYDGTNYHTVN